MTDINVDIKQTRVESGTVRDPFDRALETLQNKGYEVISTADNWRLRTEQGEYTPISINGNYVREGRIFTKRNKSKIVRNSPILLSAREATQAQESGNEFYPTEQQMIDSLEDSIEFPSNRARIPTNRFGENKLTVWLAQGDTRLAKNYGLLLGDVGITEVNMKDVTNNLRISRGERPFVRQLWLNRLPVSINSSHYDNGFLQCGCIGVLHLDWYDLRGLKKVAA